MSKTGGGTSEAVTGQVAIGLSTGWLAHNRGFCGPHCGFKDGQRRCCQNCHAQLDHGNAVVIDHGNAVVIERARDIDDAESDLRPPVWDIA